ncbi:MAG: lipoprotein signal peptidase [Bacteroidetes bacterium]|nr:MAG: lipoprotein signal peptidase [Bacteroidota bacterium]
MKRAALIIFLVLLVDQVSKIWIKTSMPLGDQFPVIGDWFYIHFVENNGMAFGWNFGGNYGKLFLSLFRLVAIGGIGYYLYKIIQTKKNTLLVVSISLIFAGALGNIIDSLFYGLIFEASGPFHIAQMFPEDGGYAGLFHGKVVDMLYFPLIDGFYPDWVPFIGGDYFAFFRPVFNVADSSITIGVALLILFQRQFFSETQIEEVIESESSNQNENAKDNNEQ